MQHSMCENCGHIKKRTKISILKRIILEFFVFLGIVMLLLLLTVGPLRMLDLAGSEMMMGMGNLKQSEKDYLRDIGLNASWECVEDVDTTTDSYCYAFEIYKEYMNIPYIPASRLDPIQTVEETIERGGDCKNTAYLYTKTLLASGIYAQAICNVTQGHCVTMVPHIKRGVVQDDFFVIDLTTPAFYVMEKWKDPWDYPISGERIRVFG